MSDPITDLFGVPVGAQTTHVEFGERFLRDCAFGKKGHVNPRPNDWNPYNGAYYAGGPKTFEVVQRTVTTITGPWEPVS